ncbi:MAG: cupredoxin domain-containing protein [Rhodothermales bacterium]
MKTMYPVRNTVMNLIPVLFLLSLLAACTGEEANRTSVEENATTQQADIPETTATPEAATPRIEDGVQVIEVTVGQMGYEPQQIALEAGIPARLVFTRTIEGDCPSQVRVPEFDVEKTDLPMNQPVAIEFTPDEAGTFQFVCGMDMMKGTLVVES